MTQPDPRKTVADTIEDAAADWSMGTIEPEVGFFNAQADRVLAALRDAGWRPPEDVQDLTEKLEYATLQLDTAAAVGRALIAERDAARATIAVDRAAHGRLFLQRDEAITERDRLQPVVEAARAWRANVPAGRMYPASTRPETAAALVAAVDAYDAQPKATGGVVKPGTVDGVGELSSHHYLSTACLHATEQGREHLHRYCQGVDGLAGRKKPAVCKFCDAPCTCDCHREERSDG